MRKRSCFFMKTVIFWRENRTKSGNITKPGTALIETALTGDPLYVPILETYFEHLWETSKVCARLIQLMVVQFRLAHKLIHTLSKCDMQIL